MSATAAGDRRRRRAGRRGDRVLPRARRRRRARARSRALPARQAVLGVPEPAGVAHPRRHGRCSIAVEQAGAAHLAGMRVRAPNGATFHGRFADVDGFRGFRDRGLALRRTILDASAARPRARVGATVREGVRVTALAHDASGRVVGVDVARRRRRSPDARRVDRRRRRRSALDRRRRLGLAATRRAQRRLALVTHFVGIDGIGDSGEMHVERDGYVGLADVGGG